MKIAQISAVFPPYRGGIGQVAYNYTQGLYDLGEKVEALTINYGLKQTYKFPVHYLRAWIRWGKAGFCPQLLWRLNKYDIVQLHYPAFGLAETVWLWRRLNKNKKLFLFYHHDLIGQGILGNIFSFYQTFFLPLLLRQADVIMVSSFDYAASSQIKKYYQQRPEKFVALPFGAKEIYQPAQDRIAQQPIEKNILFVGGLDRNHYFKGVDKLISACGLLHFSNWRLLIVGSGELVDHYQSLAEELGIADKVVFRGGIVDEELVRLYQQATVFCLPSIDQTEAFGIVLVEAMACGLPVIASDLPGVRSVVENGQSGYLVKPKDVKDLASKIEKILTDDNLGKFFSQQSSLRVEKFYRWPEIIKKLKTIYQV